MLKDNLLQEGVIKGTYKKLQLSIKKLKALLRNKKCIKHINLIS